METTVTHSAAETLAFASAFARTLRGGEIIALDGELGAGKTVFVKGLAAGLGITATITSPTFVIHKQYHCGVAAQSYILNHLDLYRMESAEEIQRLGLDDLFTANQITVLEWANRATGMLPKDCVQIEIIDLKNDVRQISIRRNELSPFPQNGDE